MTAEWKIFMKELWTLFSVFAKIGVITFGGGLSMLPNIRKEIVEKHKWATDEEVLNYYAVGQCTPGIIAVNTATFIGHKRKGIPGAIAATLGIIFPSLIIIMVIVGFIRNFTDIIWVKHAFNGIRIAVCALVLSTVIGMWKKGVKDIFGIIIYLVVLSLCLIFDISPIIIVSAAIITGISICSVRGIKE